MMAKGPFGLRENRGKQSIIGWKYANFGPNLLYSTQLSIIFPQSKQTINVWRTPVKLNCDATIAKKRTCIVFLVWDLIEECVLARRSRTCLRVKSSFHLPCVCVCVLPSKIKMLFNWPCSAPIKHVSHLSFTCLWLQVCSGVTFFFFFEKSIGVI